MNKRFLAIPVLAVILVVLAFAFAGNNFFSTNVPNESTPTPTVSSSPTYSPTPSVTTAPATSTPNPTGGALIISYREASRQVQTNAVDINIAMTVQNNEGSARNMIHDNFYLTVDGVEVETIAQTQGNFYVDPTSTCEATHWIRVKEIGSNYELHYRDNTFTVDWIKAAPTPTPTFAVTLSYRETDRRILTANDIKDPNFVGYTLVQIAINAKSNDNQTHDFTYENFYLTVNGAELNAAQQLSGTWGFNREDESTIWFMFKEIGTDYQLNYRGNSFSIEWIKQ